MAGTMGRLTVGVTGLQTSQYALNATAHNLINTQTEGYTRQQVLLTDQSYNRVATDSYYINNVGMGVVTAQIRQVRDQFADDTYRTESGRMSYYKAQYETVSEIENYFGELEGKDFNTTLNDMWTSMQELQKESNSIVTRSSFISNALTLIDRVQTIRSSLIEYQRNLNTEIKDQVKTVNDLASTIYELNQQIRAVEAGNVEKANDLKDKRNQALDKLSSIVNTEVVNNEDGTVEVYLEGHTLVTLGRTYTLTTQKVCENEKYQQNYGFTGSSTDFLMPVWEQDGDPLFNINRVPTADSNSDIGSLNGLMMSRGYFISNYTDVPTKPTKPLEKDFGVMIAYMVDMNMFDKAFQAVKLYGFDEIDSEELYRLADYGVEDSNGFLNEDLLSICIHLYKSGKVNERILVYIINHYKGDLEELAGIFKTVRNRVRDISLLAENTLAQMMFAMGNVEYIYDIFTAYYAGRNRGLVVKAFLRFACYNYLIKDAQIPSGVFDCLYQEIQKGNIEDEISRMSMLHHFSKLDRYTGEQKTWIKDAVGKFMDAGKLLPFYKSFQSFIKLPQDVMLKTYLIYKSEPGKQVTVKYAFDTGSRQNLIYKTELLDEMIPGMYVKEYVVFHGERLVYEISDDKQGTSYVVESESLKSKAFNRKDRNRFEIINSMLVNQEMREDNELLETLDVYLNTVHLFEENLSIL